MRPRRVPRNHEENLEVVGARLLGFNEAEARASESQAVRYLERWEGWKLQ